jgi:hypothetical protein
LDEKDFDFRYRGRGRLDFAATGKRGLSVERAFFQFGAALLSAGSSILGAEPEFFQRGAFLFGAAVPESELCGGRTTLFSKRRVSESDVCRESQSLFRRSDDGV